MRALSLCQACKRHIRVTESACPFCGAAFTPLAEPTGLRPRGRPGGRAALFLVGSAVAGCTEEADPESVDMAVYGAPIDPGVYVIPPYGVAVPADAGPPGDAGIQMAVPVYGVAVYGAPPDRDGGADANACGDPQPPMAVPVYGVALDGFPLVGPGPRNPDASPCGQDAGKPSDAGPPPDARPLATPPYGIGIDLNRDAATRDGQILGTPVYGLWSEIDPQEDE